MVCNFQGIPGVGVPLGKGLGLEYGQEVNGEHMSLQTAPNPGPLSSNQTFICLGTGKGKMCIYPGWERG